MIKLEIREEAPIQIDPNQDLGLDSEVLFSDLVKCLEKAKDQTRQANALIELVRDTLKDHRVQVKFVPEK